MFPRLDALRLSLTVSDHTSPVGSHQCAHTDSNATLASASSCRAASRKDGGASRSVAKTASWSFASEPVRHEERSRRRRCGGERHSPASVRSSTDVVIPGASPAAPFDDARLRRRRRLERETISSTYNRVLTRVTAPVSAPAGARRLNSSRSRRRAAPWARIPRAACC